MPKLRTIEMIEFGKMFGASVIRGYVEGRNFTALLRWTARARVGISWGQLGTDEVLAIGSYRGGWTWPEEWKGVVDIRSKRANMAEAV